MQSGSQEKLASWEGAVELGSKVCVGIDRAKRSRERTFNRGRGMERKRAQCGWVHSPESTWGREAESHCRKQRGLSGDKTSRFQPHRALMPWRKVSIRPLFSSVGLSPGIRLKERWKGISALHPCVSIFLHHTLRHLCKEQVHINNAAASGLGPEPVRHWTKKETCLFSGPSLDTIISHALQCEFSLVGLKHSFIFHILSFLKKMEANVRKKSNSKNPSVPRIIIAFYGALTRCQALGTCFTGIVSFHIHNIACSRHFSSHFTNEETKAHRRRIYLRWHSSQVVDSGLEPRSTLYLLESISSMQHLLSWKITNTSHHLQF